ncbi:hypothetical protein Phou_060650 [Phytohabitans houttuyneae]|uniref:Uncharacterized protein n=1 Tax=Phytohabitans houttuyneae TaxID=1076126 RepID=A0A6V8KMK7_9ACTN|nr:hypothetical protein Phou_060650 [Phytohabitans houttuyneae]
MPQVGGGGAAQAQRAEGVDGGGDRVEVGEGLQPAGKVATGTKVELVKISGMTASSPPVPAASGSRTSRPSRAKTHENAIPTHSARPMAAAAAAGPAWKRNPMAYPTPVINARTNRFRTVSAATRPASTADRATGSARNRSIMPVARSSATATAVCEAPNAIASTHTPGSR